MNSNIYRTALAAMRKQAALPPSGLVHRAARSVLGYPIGALTGQAILNKTNKQRQPPAVQEPAAPPAPKDEQWHGQFNPPAPQQPGNAPLRSPEQMERLRIMRDRLLQDSVQTLPGSGLAPTYFKQDHYRQRPPKMA